MNAPTSFKSSPPLSETEDDDMESHRSTVVSTSTRRNKKPTQFDIESAQYMGIDAVKKLRTHYTINRVCT